MHVQGRSKRLTTFTPSCLPSLPKATSAIAAETPPSLLLPLCLPLPRHWGKNPNPTLRFQLLGRICGSGFKPLLRERTTTVPPRPCPPPLRPRPGARGAALPPGGPAAPAPARPGPAARSRAASGGGEFGGGEFGGGICVYLPLLSSGELSLNGRWVSKGERPVGCRPARARRGRFNGRVLCQALTYYGFVWARRGL